MKTKTLLILGVACLAITILHLHAGNTVLSPRAAVNQITVVASDVSATSAVLPTDTSRLLLSPREAASQIVKINDTTITTVKCTAMGSPKFLATADNNAKTACCGMTLNQCPSMTACTQSN